MIVSQINFSGKTESEEGSTMVAENRNFGEGQADRKLWHCDMF
jgi:hypothetical protein